jgi:hypothetical protein
MYPKRFLTLNNSIKMPHSVLISSTRATCPFHFILLESSLRILLHPRTEVPWTDPFHIPFKAIQFSPLPCLFPTSHLVILFTGMLAVTDKYFLAISSLDRLPSAKGRRKQIQQWTKGGRFGTAFPTIQKTLICGRVKGPGTGCNTNAVLLNYMNH